MEMLEIRYRPLGKDVREVYRLAEKKRLPMKIFETLLLAVILFLYGGRLFFGPTAFDGIVLAVSVFLLFRIWVYPVQKAKQVAKGIDASEEYFTFLLYEDGFAPGKEADKVLFADGVSAQEIEELFIIRAHSTFVLPKRDLKEGDEEKIRSLLSPVLTS